jgi:hypothetical protein
MSLFFTLPLELRVLIYRLLVLPDIDSPTFERHIPSSITTEKAGITSMLLVSKSPFTWPSLRLVCREFYEILSQLVYAKTEFYMCNMGIALSFLNSINPTNRNSLRFIILEVDQDAHNIHAVLRILQTKDVPLKRLRIIAKYSNESLLLDSFPADVPIEVVQTRQRICDVISEHLQRFDNTESFELYGADEATMTRIEKNPEYWSKSE